MSRIERNARLDPTKLVPISAKAAQGVDFDASAASEEADAREVEKKQEEEEKVRAVQQKLEEKKRAHAAAELEKARQWELEQQAQRERAAADKAERRRLRKQQRLEQQKEEVGGEVAAAAPELEEVWEGMEELLFAQPPTPPGYCTLPAPPSVSYAAAAAPPPPYPSLSLPSATAPFATAVSVEEFLDSLNLGRLLPVFQKEDFDMDGILLLEEGHLNKLGLKLGPKLRILKAVGIMREAVSV